jgi:hypothetical protein
VLAYTSELPSCISQSVHELSGGGLGSRFSRMLYPQGLFGGYERRHCKSLSLLQK